MYLTRDMSLCPGHGPGIGKCAAGPLSFRSLCAGNRTSQALLGMQLQPRDLEEFEQVTKALENDFSFTTLAGEARRVFDMFIQ